MENDLHCLGVTGFEDLLQLGVIETIESMQRAGICMCAMTGDRTETAINVAKAYGDIKNERVKVIKPEQAMFKRRHASSAVVTGDVHESFRETNFKFIEYLPPAEAVAWCAPRRRTRWSSRRFRSTRRRLSLRSETAGTASQ